MRFPMLVLLALLVASITTLWTFAGWLAGYLATRRPVPLDGPRPPVSVLKPLSGADAERAANLETFFRQDHPEFELLFGAIDADDPALDVVRRVAERYPHVPC